MTPKELASELQKLKVEATRLGYVYIQEQLPIEVKKFGKVMAPIIRIEQAFNKSIQQLNKL